jgi:hypothetical protein
MGFSLSSLRAWVGRTSRKIVQLVQAVLLPLLLALVYLVGVGLTFVVAAVFDRRLLRGAWGRRQGWWVEARGYEASRQEMLKQS